MAARYLAIGCPRCRARRVAEQGRKTASCHRCGSTIDLRASTPLFASPHLEEVQAFLGQEAARASPAGGWFARVGAAEAPPRGERERERARIAVALGAASGRANQLKLILRRGFEAFGEVTVEDLAAIARQAELDVTAEELALEAVDLGLAGRSASGALVPLREGP